MSQADSNKNLKLLFQHPLEPVFAKKDNGQTAIQIPPDYYTERYANIGNSLSTRFGEEAENVVVVRPVSHPHLEFTKKIPRRGGFSIFKEEHRGVAAQLIKLFLEQKDAETLFSIGAFVKDRVNPFLFQYALSVAVQHRKDTRNVTIPPLVKQFPHQFIDAGLFPTIRQEARILTRAERENIPIDIPLNFTASPRDKEQRMAYFREDLGVNMHHWHWHLVYPTSPIEVANKDRRGELFYYMHSQILARYNNDRICNNLACVVPLSDLRAAIPEGYFPKLLKADVTKAYPPRVDRAKLYDLSPSSDSVVHIFDLEQWRDRIHEAIDKGFVVEADTNRIIPLSAEKGIDILGNIVEASDLSPNRRLYGDLHNMGHNIISRCHDPENRHLEEDSVMSQVETAMRDPIFYRWHAFIDTVFKRFKNHLAPYSEEQLSYMGIVVESVNVQSSSKDFATNQNELYTYWQFTEVDLANGLDFYSDGITVRFQHLQHAPFTYNINVNNNTARPHFATCRIFLIPLVDERNVPLNFSQQRLMAIEMDKWTVNLLPGKNEIQRSSFDSSVTIPYERFLQLTGAEKNEGNVDFGICGCGWPHHLLLPKGQPGGAKFHLFVMVSNDRPAQPPNTNLSCNDAYSFCGLRDQNYPDRRAMGFPFDRDCRFQSRDFARTESMQQFSNLLPNAAYKDVTINFSDQIISP